MRIPYYLAQYQQTEAKAATDGPAPTVLPVILVGGIVLLYVGMLVVLLLGLGL